MIKIEELIIGIISIVITFLLLAELIPILQTAGNSLNASGAPLGSLFVENGVLITALMASILIAIIAGVFAFKKKK